MGAAIAFAVTAPLASCSDDDDDEPDPVSQGNNNNQGNAPQKFIGLDITQNTTWSEDTVYILTSRIKVKPPATLTINPGTIIKGAEGQGSNAKVLMVMRNAKIMAEGTASKPIIFTTVRDNIQPGQIQSPNLPNDLTGQWGGLALLGNARVATGQNLGAAFEQAQIEGVPASDQDGLYGGTNDADNSGVLKFVSVRHGGTTIGAGNELNGISFGGVGSGTIVENIEIVANADDGVEFYGGTVDVTNVVVWNNGDDAIDTDQGYTGTIDNAFVVGPAGSCFELDGPEGGSTNFTGNHTIKNVTVVAVRPDGTSAGDLLNFDDNTNISMENIYYSEVKTSQKLGKDNTTSPNATFSNFTLNVAAGTASSYLPTGADPKVAAAVSVGSISPSNAAEFDNWSWAGVAGNLGSL